MSSVNKMPVVGLTSFKNPPSAICASNAIDQVVLQNKIAEATGQENSQSASTAYAEETAETESSTEITRDGDAAAISDILEWTFPNCEQSQAELL